MVSIFLRSLLFNILFYPNFVFWALVALPTLVMPRKALMRVANWWGQSIILLMRIVCNIRVEYRGIEKIPKGPLIVAAKHQSAWETMSLLQFFDRRSSSSSASCCGFRLFGQYLKKANMIAIDRSSGARALKQMVRRASEEVQHGRQLVIFPEGTRRPVGAPPHYKAGVAPDLCRLWRAVSSGRAQFRPVLAAPHLLALSRHAGDGVPRSAAAGFAAR